jgi:hypothetical protein
MLNQSPFLWYEEGMEKTTLPIERLKERELILKTMTAFKE